MAIDQGSETVTIKTEERTWRIQIETPKGADASITIFREVVRYLPDGTVLSKEAGGEVRRSLSQVAAQAFQLKSGTMTGADVAGALAAIADVWRAEDLRAE